MVAPRLAPLPESYAMSRDALHRLAAYVVAPARKRGDGEISLRWTPGGFGTPPFGSGEQQVRVDGDELVFGRDGQEARQRITTLGAAARLAGVRLVADPGVGSDLPPLGGADELLPVDATGALALGDWYGFAASVIEAVRQELTAEGVEVSPAHLWPEHFDLAIDDGRCNYGFSPGDAFHAEPYVYVGPFDRSVVTTGGFWNAPFGALLTYADLVAADDQPSTALGFLRRGLAQLGSGSR